MLFRSRGSDGAALVNFSGKQQRVRIDTTLPDGEYTDSVHDSKFRVRNGLLDGTLAPNASYILYSAARK